MAYERIPLSGSTNGRPISITATATAGTTFHTAQSGTTLMDVVTLYACNTDTVTRQLTLEWGGTGGTNNLIFDIPAKATVLLFADLVICNSSVCAAFCPTTAVINVAGFVNRES